MLLNDASSQLPVSLRAEPILKVYDGRFITSLRSYDQEFRARFESAGLTYEHA